MFLLLFFGLLLLLLFCLRFCLFFVVLFCLFFVCLLFRVFVCVSFLLFWLSLLLLFCCCCCCYDFKEISDLCSNCDDAPLRKTRLWQNVARWVDTTLCRMKRLQRVARAACTCAHKYSRCSEAARFTHQELPHSVRNPSLTRRKKNVLLMRSVNTERGKIVDNYSRG